ncbi:MAG: MotA/TolQ/ExbB proton channel family protein [Terrimicrobiaceae bacterium]|jgi:biopolymer transport protein ExbB
MKKPMEKNRPKNPNKPVRLLLAVLVASGALAFAATLEAQEAPAPAGAAQTAKPPKDKTLLDTFLVGGPLMWPILLCSIGTAGVAVYCFLHINGNKLMPKTQVEAVGQYMQARDAASAYSLCHSQPNIFANTMAAALLKVNFERDLANKLSMEQAAGETLANEDTKLSLWVNYLNVFATIGPMLGLLGTVTGMIASFDMLAAGRSEPSDLAGGIGEAMITTAGGLFVGIPAMFLYFYFRNLLTIHIAAIQKRVTFMLDLLSGELKIEGASAEYENPQE